MNTENISSQYKELGIAEYKKRNYQSAIKHFTDAINCKDDPAFISNRAACYQQLKNYDACIKDCNYILEYDPTFHKAYTRKAQALICIGALEKAINSFRQGLDTDTGRNDPVLKKSLNQANMLIRYYEDTNKAIEDCNFVDAIRKCEMILEECPNFNEIELKRIQLWNKNGDLEKSRNRIEYLISIRTANNYE